MTSLLELVYFQRLCTIQLKVCVRAKGAGVLIPLLKFRARQISEETCHPLNHCNTLSGSNNVWGLF